MMQIKLYLHILNQTQGSEINSEGLGLNTVIHWDPGLRLEITQPNGGVKVKSLKKKKERCLFCNVAFVLSPC